MFCNRFRTFLILAAIAISPAAVAGAVNGTGPSVSGDPPIYSDTTGLNIAPSGGILPNAVHFKSGTPWADVEAFGALCNSSADDTSAFNSAISAVQALGGGTVYVPPTPGGYCCLKTGVTVSGSTPVRIVGSATRASSIGACGADVTPLTLNSPYSSMEYMQVSGKGNPSDATFGATQPAVMTGANCETCRLYYNYVVFGWNAILITGDNNVIEKNQASNSYGSAVVEIAATGFYRRNTFDQAAPSGTMPAFPFTIAAWAPSAVYAANTFVSDGGYYLQVITGGTSGSSLPALKNYGLDISDGSVTWRLADPVNGSDVELERGAYEVSMDDNDYSGFYGSCAIRVTGNGSGRTVGYFKLTRAVIGYAYGGGVCIQDGGGAHLFDNEISACMVPGCAGISFSGTNTGDSIIDHNFIFDSTYGIAISSGTNYTITGNQLYGSTGSCIYIGAGISKFNISDNTIGHSDTTGTCATGVTVAAGASDNYNIIGNIVAGATTGINDGGTGTHKTPFGNN